MEKRRPHYRAAELKKGLCSTDQLHMTVSALKGAVALNLGSKRIIRLIQELALKDFHKSIQPEMHPSQWIDIYHPVIDSKILVFQLTARSKRYLILQLESKYTGGH